MDLTSKLLDAVVSSLPHGLIHSLSLGHVASYRPAMSPIPTVDTRTRAKLASTDTDMVNRVRMV